MKKQKKQNLLTAIIIILVIALVLMIGSIVYEEVINMSKQPIQDTNSPVIDENVDEEDEQQENQTVVDDETENEDENESEENENTSIEPDNKKEFFGEEEGKKYKEPENTTDEKVVDLVKKEWGNDTSVTFTIEKKNGSKYRVAVRDSSTTVLAWYEVNIDTWEVNEY